MRPASALVLVRFFLLFVVRRILSRGILRSKIARWSSAVGVCSAFVGYCLLSVAVLRQMFGGAEFIGPIVTSAAISTLFWVAVAYTVIRVLFLKGDELLQLSFSLPVTNKERTLAFGLFEALIIVIALCAAFGGLATACLLFLGPDAVSLLMTGIAMPALSLYLCASLAYLVIERMLAALGLARLRGLVVPVVLAGILVLAFQTVNIQSQDFLRSFISGDTYVAPQLIYVWLEEEFGLLSAIGAFLAFALIAGLMIQLVSPRSYVPVKRYFKLLPACLASTRFGAHFLVLVRSFETGVVLVFIAVVSVVVWVNQLSIPPFAMLLATFQGIYTLSNSQPLRRIGPRVSTAAMDYFFLVAPQAVLLSIVAIPTAIIAAVGGTGLLTSAAIAGFGLANICMSTLVGIAFPPEKGNPFSVLIGVVLMMVVVGALAIGLNVFNLPPYVNVAVIGAAALVSVAYGVYGIRQIERKQRYENEVAA